MKYTVYNIATGKILQIVQTNDISIQLQEGEAYLEGSIDDSTYYIENGVPVAIPSKPDKHAVFDYVTKQWIQNEKMIIAEVSQKRQKLLYSCDWTQLPNGPLTQEQKEQWATYRQALRDITDQPEYPSNVVWPVRPS